MKINNGERNRVFILFLILCVWILFIGATLIKVQVVDYGKNISRIHAQTERIVELNSRRGTIYDCNGEVMAISIKAYSAFLNNKNNLHSHRLITDMIKAGVLPLDSKEKKLIRKRIDKAEKFIWLKRKLTDLQYQALKNFKPIEPCESNVEFLDEYRRVYPQKSLASHILGAVGIDEQGLYGIEYAYDSILKGKVSKMRIEQDARKKAFDFQYIQEPEDGKDIYLTIDSSIQFFVEKELSATMQKFEARGGAVIAMDSRTGSILAMASYPGFDPDKLNDARKIDIRNKAVSMVYHPGSTFKIIVTSVALEDNLCSPEQMFNCEGGVYNFKNLTIYDEHKYGALSFEDIVVHSSNIGAAKIGERMGKKRLYDGIRLFQFGDKVGINLPDEEAGIVHPMKNWSAVSVDFLAYGYEIGVTPLQMIRAFNVIASGGYLMKPYLVKETPQDTPFVNQKKKILSPGTVQRMVSIMTQVVERGTGKNSRVDGVTIAAKTGTTKKISRNKDSLKYISSFGGFFPASDPRITMFVVIDEPKGQFYGGDVAAPLFKAISEKIMVHLGVYPEKEEKKI